MYVNRSKFVLAHMKVTTLENRASVIIIHKDTNLVITSYFQISPTICLILLQSLKLYFHIYAYSHIPELHSVLLKKTKFSIFWVCFSYISLFFQEMDILIQRYYRGSYCNSVFYFTFTLEFYL